MRLTGPYPATHAVLDWDEDVQKSRIAPVVQTNIEVREPVNGLFIYGAQAAGEAKSNLRNVLFLLFEPPSSPQSSSS